MIMQNKPIALERAVECLTRDGMMIHVHYYFSFSGIEEMKKQTR